KRDWSSDVCSSDLRMWCWRLPRVCGARVVVGTPGRVIVHLKRGSLKLGSLQHLILDEADEMLKMGFAEDIEEIFSQVGDNRQVALFSATMPTSIHRITGKYLDDPKEVRIAAKSQTG